MSRFHEHSIGSMLLDSEGLARAIRRDPGVYEWINAARSDKAPVLTSAATLVEVMHPRMNRAAFDWALARVEVRPLTDQLARRAAALLKVAGRHGHTYAIDAMVAATALAAQPPVTVLTSDPEDLRLLCGDRVVVIGL